MKGTGGGSLPNGPSGLSGLELTAKLLQNADWQGKLFLDVQLSLKMTAILKDIPIILIILL